MHSTLRKTHFEGNINLLKVRDYYFNKARIMNNSYRKWCLLAPILLSVLGMAYCVIANIFFQEVPIMMGIMAFVENWLDIAVGTVAVLSFIIDCILSSVVGNYLSISNYFREQYDCEVFEIPENRFFVTEIGEKKASYLEKAKDVLHSDKYEVWYRELFSENDFCNSICMIMDNIIYTYHVYKENSKRIFRVIVTYLVVFLMYGFLYFYVSDQNLVLVNPFILVFAFFDEIKELVTSFSTAKELYMDNKSLKEYIIENEEEIKNTPDEEQKQFIRYLQDVVYFNRTKALFIPKSIRDKFLDNQCIFYWELDEVKSIFMGNQVSKPENEDDFEIPVPLSKSQGKEEFVKMKDIHEELRIMLEDMKKVLDEAGIEFLLDGGTLIGSIRQGNNNGFLAWDDDVDISIRTEDVQKAKKILAEKLGDKYVIQDYYNEKYYSPRLSTFRMRQKNNCSFIDEKDSPLYELYQERGLFIDVYAYSPILISKNIDYIYRKLMIYPLHKHIKRVENKWKTEKHKEKVLNTFLKLKKKYMKRSEWYKKQAKCTDFYTYEPHYIENINTPGPYIPKEDLYYPTVSSATFNGMKYGVPARPENVLRAFYGKNWESSPLIPVEVLKQPKENQYHAILGMKLVDYLFKQMLIMPKIKKKGALSQKEKEHNDYTKYASRIKLLNNKIVKYDTWYCKHAKNEKTYALKPASINKNSVNLYYEKDMIISQNVETVPAGFNQHMFSQSSFEASVYKHVKGVWINGKGYNHETKKRTNCCERH